MENSYRFYSNRACKYFPCHQVAQEEDFNCMFCYCPLYLLEECGGKYEIYNGVKDCSNCMVPHSVKGYDHINKKLVDEIARRKVELYGLED